MRAAAGTIRLLPADSCQWCRSDAARRAGTQASQFKKTEKSNRLCGGTRPQPGRAISSRSPLIMHRAPRGRRALAARPSGACWSAAPATSERKAERGRWPAASGQRLAARCCHQPPTGSYWPPSHPAAQPLAAPGCPCHGALDISKTISRPPPAGQCTAAQEAIGPRTASCH